MLWFSTNEHGLSVLANLFICKYNLKLLFLSSLNIVDRILFVFLMMLLIFSTEK